MQFHIKSLFIALTVKLLLVFSKNVNRELTGTLNFYTTPNFGGTGGVVCVDTIQPFIVTLQSIKIWYNDNGTYSLVGLQATVINTTDIQITNTEHGGGDTAGTVIYTPSYKIVKIQVNWGTINTCNGIRFMTADGVWSPWYGNATNPQEANITLTNDESLIGFAGRAGAAIDACAFQFMNSTCSTSSDCPPMTPICNSSGICISCSHNSDCPSGTNLCINATCVSTPTCPPACSAPYPYCHSGHCTPCTTNAECPLPGAPVCSTTNFACGPCTTNTDCQDQPGLPYCAYGTCVQCENNSECPFQAPVCTAGACGYCQTNSDCLNFPSLAYCWVGNGSCVECLQNSECVAINNEFPYCLTSSYTCVQCLNRENCTTYQPFCNATNWCVPCSLNSECLAGTFCLHPRCVECDGNSPNCTGDKPICNTTNFCGPCTFNSECTPPSVCSTPFCVQCNQNSDCSIYPSTTVCLASAHTCVTCLTNEECGGNTPVCNTVTNQCVPCTSNSECTSPLVCLNPNCGQCNSNSECTPLSGTQWCNTTTHLCVQCLKNSECSGSTPICSDINTCISCKINSECTSPLVCAHPLCVQCKTNSECSSPNPACDTATNTCVPCNSNSDCSGGTPVCNTTTHQCVQCLINSNCSNPSPICVSNVCKPCLLNSECDYPNVCATPSCVQCKKNIECFVGQSECNTTTHRCVECLGNAECTNPTQPICTSSNICVGCASNSECTPPLVCSPPNCVNCLTNMECIAPSTPVCDTNTHNCVQCMNNKDCSSSTPLCKTSTNTCVQCLSNSNCSSNTPHCTSSNTCVACRTNSECTYPQVCYDHNCVQCVNNLECGGNQAYCNTTTNTCVQCLGTPNCTSKTAPICSVNDTCVPCTNNSECFPNVCSSPYCVMCNTNLECLDPTPFCNQNHECVQCLSNQECTILSPICQNYECQADSNIAPLTICLSVFLSIGATLSVIASTFGIHRGNTNFVRISTWLETIYCFLFMNINYPLDLETFFMFFKVVNLQSIPNPVGFFADLNNVEAANIPYIFSMNGMSGIYLKDMGQNFLIFFVLMVIHFTVVALKKTIEKPIKILTTIRNTLGLQRIAFIMYSFSLMLMTSIFTQFFYGGFGASIEIVSLIFGIGTIGIFGYICYDFNKLLKKAKQLDKVQAKKLLKANIMMLEGFISKTKDSANPFLIIVIGKNALSALLLIAFFNFPYIQIGCQIIIMIIFMGLLIYKKPYTDKLENKCNIALSALLICAYGLLIPLAYSEAFPSRDEIGTGILTICMVIIGILLVLVGAEIHRGIKDILKKRKKQQEKAKEKAKKEEEDKNPFKVKPKLFSNQKTSSGKNQTPLKSALVIKGPRLQNQLGNKSYLKR